MLRRQEVSSNACLPGIVWNVGDPTDRPLRLDEGEDAPTAVKTVQSIDPEDLLCLILATFTSLVSNKEYTLVNLCTTSSSLAAYMDFIHLSRS